MLALRIAIIIFIVLELSNILIMYFKPDFKYGNSMKSFKEWGKSKENQTQHMFIKYMVNWVANCKFIFIAMLIVVLILNNELLTLYSVIAIIISISLYFITLHPIIRKLDKLGEIEPKGYSKQLALTIAVFILMFVIALIIYFVV